jgi:hypothetical protein
MGTGHVQHAVAEGGSYPALRGGLAGQNGAANRPAGPAGPARVVVPDAGRTGVGQFAGSVARRTVRATSWGASSMGT